MNLRPTIDSGPALGLWQVLRRGFGCRCPRCGKGAIFRGYVKVNARCADCGLPLDGYRVDDAPPYFTILIVGHIVLPGLLLLEEFAHPPAWFQLALWLPLTLGLTLFLLRRVKGALVGLHWANEVKG